VDVARIGRHLAWHGALSVDYILQGANETPLYIDCNPRLVEPMSAEIAGANLISLLLAVSLGESPAPVPEGRTGVRTHLGLQVLMGCALSGGSRRDILGEMCKLVLRRPPYADTAEELTPVALDWPSAVPFMLAAALLTTDPRAARWLQRQGWGAHLLGRKAIALIKEGLIQ
jgi:hypothetical protein